MSDTGLEQTEPTISVIGNEPSEAGDIRLGDRAVLAPEPDVVLTPEPVPAVPAPQRRQDQSATVEHLAVRRSVPALDPQNKEIKERLTELRSAMTTLVT